MPQDGDAFDPEAPCESRDLFGIVTYGFENRRMHHAASAELNPSGFLAHLAAGSVALPAADVDFGTRFGVREEARTEPHPGVRRKHFAHEGEQRALEVRH